ncbi:MAG: hypothetical protein CVU42_01465 [Chloroflexi bacterium HGW-Chloroflexi-4]|jgi:DNA-binding SARP family transcriptional activator|nr:MAG: hypothetical protein CVU42_01465 [Chloroflexi bacterium HGW-Chloroflexi-4]
MQQPQFDDLILDAKLFGGFEISINSCVISEISSQKARGLFAYLLLENPRVHARNTLAAIFWPDVPEQTALHNLRQALTTVKKAVSESISGVEIFSSDRDTLGFSEKVVIHVDILDFENKIQTLLDHHNARKSRGFPIIQLKRTMAQITGQMLPLLTLPDSDLFEDWLALKRERIDRFLVLGYSILLKYHEDRCEWLEARKIAEKLITIAPWDEDFHARLIQIYLQAFQPNAALTQYHSAVRYLQNNMDIEPGIILKNALVDIQNNLSTGKIQRTRKVLSVNLPGYATPFVGRNYELEVLENWVSNPKHHVITLTGPGGSGKTRLAAELASTQNALFKDGVFFVSIANCYSVEHIASTILALSKTSIEHTSNSMEELMEWAAHRCALLVLDNVENLNEAALFAKQLTEAAPQIVLLFTSYSFLDLVGEKVFALGGLSTSDGEHSDAVNLFYSHLQVESHPEMNDPVFSTSVVKICDLVEGFPLAIDLAACQTKWIPIDEILVGLQENINSLITQSINLPERHRSIQASFENVWYHLSDQDRLLFARLTLFENPFSVQAALAVCDVDASFLKDFAKRSLLIWDGIDGYRFHRVVKQNVIEFSTTSKQDLQKYKEKHAFWFKQQVLEFFADRKDEKLIIFYENFEKILADIEAGLYWFVQNQKWNEIDELVTPLNVYFENRSYFREGTKLFEKLINSIPEEDTTLICRAKLICRNALFRIRIQQFEGAEDKINFGLETARAAKLFHEEAYCLNALATHALVKKSSSTACVYAEKALELSRKIHDKEEESHSLYNLGYAHVNLGEISEAERNLFLCRDICNEFGNIRRLSKVLNILADIACIRGDYKLALLHYGQALEIGRAMNNLYFESLTLNNAGTAYLELMDYPNALNCFGRSVEICSQIGDREGEAIALSNLGETFAYQKDFENAVLYNEQALTISEEIGSELGILSARAILAEGYRELGDTMAAKNELIQLLTLSLTSESMNFFHRGIVEACRLLMMFGKVDRLVSLLDETIRSEGAEESTRQKAIATRQQLINTSPSSLPMDPKSIHSFLISKLNQIS